MLKAAFGQQFLPSLFRAYFSAAGLETESIPWVAGVSHLFLWLWLSVETVKSLGESCQESQSEGDQGPQSLWFGAPAPQLCVSEIFFLTGLVVFVQGTTELVLYRCQNSLSGCGEHSQTRSYSPFRQQGSGAASTLLDGMGPSYATRLQDGCSIAHILGYLFPGSLSKVPECLLISHWEPNLL